MNEWIGWNDVWCWWSWCWFRWTLRPVLFPSQSSTLHQFDHLKDRRISDHWLELIRYGIICTYIPFANIQFSIRFGNLLQTSPRTATFEFGNINQGLSSIRTHVNQWGIRNFLSQTLASSTSRFRIVSLWNLVTIFDVKCCTLNDPRKNHQYKLHCAAVWREKKQRVKFHFAWYRG